MSVAPHKVREVRGGVIDSEESWNRVVSRINPYPPSFNNNPARIMEPAIGASTWAFGNQRCSVNRGSFTMNASTVLSHQSVVLVRVGVESGRYIFKWRL